MNKQLINNFITSYLEDFFYIKFFNDLGKIDYTIMIETDYQAVNGIISTQKNIKDVIYRYKMNEEELYNISLNDIYYNFFIKNRIIYDDKVYNVQYSKFKDLMSSINFDKSSNFIYYIDSFKIYTNSNNFFIYKLSKNEKNINEILIDRFNKNDFIDFSKRKFKKNVLYKLYNIRLINIYNGHKIDYYLYSNDDNNFKKIFNLFDNSIFKIIIGEIKYIPYRFIRLYNDITTRLGSFVEEQNAEYYNKGIYLLNNY